MKLFRLQDICPETYKRLKEDKTDVSCPKCKRAFHGCEAYLSIHNDIQHDGNKEFKAVSVDGNNYFLTCQFCKQVLIHGFRVVHGGINGKYYMQ